MPSSRPAAIWSLTTGSMRRPSSRRWQQPGASEEDQMRMRRGVGRVGRPGLVGTMARTAVVAGTATAVVGGVSRHQQGEIRPADRRGCLGAATAAGSDGAGSGRGGCRPAGRCPGRAPLSRRATAASRAAGACQAEGAGHPQRGGVCRREGASSEADTEGQPTTMLSLLPSSFAHDPGRHCHDGAVVVRQPLLKIRKEAPPARRRRGR